MTRRTRWALPAAAGCAALFLVLAVAANAGTTPWIDRAIEDQVHHWVVAHPPWPQIGRVAGVITEPTNLRIAAVLIAAGLFATRRWRIGAWLLATMALSAALGIVLKLIFARPRPVWPDPISVAGGYSFPSGHALNSAAAAGCVVALLTLVSMRSVSARRWVTTGRACAVLFALAAGVDRVIIGVHYPSDVLAGWAAGACVVLVMWSTLEPIRGPMEQQARSTGDEAEGP